MDYMQQKFPLHADKVRVNQIKTRLFKQLQFIQFWNGLPLNFFCDIENVLIFLASHIALCIHFFAGKIFGVAQKRAA